MGDRISVQTHEGRHMPAPLRHLPHFLSDLFQQPSMMSFQNLQPRELEERLS